MIASPLPSSAPKRPGKTPLRHRRVLRDNLNGISKADIRRLARRGGVKRLAADIYPETREVLRNYLRRIIRTSVVYAEHATRKTVSVYDVIHALKYEGHTLFGYEPIGPRSTNTRTSIRPRISAATPRIPTVPPIPQSVNTAIQDQSPSIDTDSQPKTEVRKRVVSRKESQGDKRDKH